MHVCPECGTVLCMLSQVLRTRGRECEGSRQPGGCLCLCVWCMYESLRSQVCVCASACSESVCANVQQALTLAVCLVYTGIYKLQLAFE